MAKKGTWIVGTLIIVGAAVAWSATRKGPEAPEATTTRVVRTRIEEWVRASGHVEPSNSVRVSANVTGELVQLLVREGHQVVKGQVLAEIDRGPVNAVLRQRLASLKAARSTAGGEAAQLDELTRQVDKERALQAKGVTAGDELARLEAESRIARAKLQSARFRAEQAEAEYEELRVRVGQSQVLAPVAGTIISVEKKQGERIRGSDMVEDVLLVLAPLDAMEVEIAVTEQDVVNLQVGVPAKIAMHALGLTDIPGKVVAIASSATVIERGTATEITRFLVKLTFDQIPERLRPGMTAQVSILARSKDKVLAVPFEAVAARPRSVLSAPGGPLAGSTAGGAGSDSIPIVFVHDGGIAHARPVTTGLAGDHMLEILEGLSEGDEIISAPYQLVHQDLWHGAQVRAFPEAPSSAAESAP